MDKQNKGRYVYFREGQVKDAKFEEQAVIVYNQGEKDEVAFHWSNGPDFRPYDQDVLANPQEQYCVMTLVGDEFHCDAFRELDIIFLVPDDSERDYKTKKEKINHNAEKIGLSSKKFISEKIMGDIDHNKTYLKGDKPYARDQWVKKRHIANYVKLINPDRELYKKFNGKQELPNILELIYLIPEVVLALPNNYFRNPNVASKVETAYKEGLKRKLEQLVDEKSTPKQLLKFKSIVENLNELYNKKVSSEKEKYKIIISNEINMSWDKHDKMQESKDRETEVYGITNDIMFLIETLEGKPSHTKQKERE